MKIIKILFAFIILLAFQSKGQSQADYIGNVQTLPGHPRILMLKGEEEAIKKTIAADHIWQDMHQAILKESDNLLSVAPIERIQIGRRLLDKSREALRRIFFLSYAYRMTGDQKYFQRTEKEMLTIAAFSDWNPSHFLDVAEMTMAMAIGYDWLYDHLSEQSKAAIKEAILKKGIEPSLDSKYNSWLRAEHNWNQVCNAGMSFGAMAIYEDQPALAKQIINRAIETVKLPMKDFGPDGAYPEGYGYWGYGTGFNVMLNSAIEKLFGNDFGLNSQPGFLRTAGYLENMTGPSGNPFNYSDAGGSGGLQPPMFWFASKTKDPALLWVEKTRLTKLPASSHVRNRLLPAIMIWSDGISLNRIAAPESKIWVGKGKSPVALMRTSWTDTNAIFVGVKAGSASVNHAHMDIGSFIMEADGVRWAMDFGMQDYESLESKGIALFGRTQDAQRWSVFRYNNFVHNTLTVNNQYQKVAGYAPITKSSDNNSFMFATVDLGETYKGQVAGANRGVAIVNQEYVTVRDEIRTRDTATIIRWTMLTPADVKITGKNTAELTKNGRKLFLQVNEPATISMKTWTTVSPNSYDAANPGTTLVGFEVRLPANTNATLSVNLVPQKAVKQLTKKSQPLAKWK